MVLYKQLFVVSIVQCCRKTPLYRTIKKLFSLNHAIWDSYGHLGGRPRCITVWCRGVQSPAFLGQFCPTISIKLSTAKVRQFYKCGGVRGHESPRVATPKGIYPVSVVQAQIQGTGHQKQYSVYFNHYVYQYRGRLRCKGTKTSTASFRTPDFDCRYFPPEHWCLYSSSSST